MAGSTAAISSPLPHHRDSAGLVGRLLRRTTSAKESARFERTIANGTAETKEPSRHPTERRISACGATQHPLEPTAATTTQNQAHHTRKGSRGLAGEAMVETQSTAQQPQLKKKASFRDRLKVWPKPIQNPETIPEVPRPKFVYEPTHAASDFSRLAISPKSATRQQTEEPSQSARPVRSSGENGVRRNSQNGSQQGSGQGLRREEPTRRSSRVGMKLNPRTLVEDPFQASQEAVLAPVNSTPVAWDLRVSGEISAGREGESAQQQPTAPLTDYELFIARAEAEERARREQILRSISQHSAAAAALSPKPNHVKPDPHKQYYTSTSIPSDTVGPGSSHHHHQRNNSTGNSRSKGSTGNRYMLSSSRGNDEQRPAFRKGHVQRASWAPSYTTGGSEAEKVLVRTEERVTVPRQPGPSPSQAQAGYGVDGQPQPQRMLRRQASLTQRIANYIRPAKGVGTGAGRVGHIGTLVE